MAGVSRKVHDKQERSRLREIIQDVRSEGYGIIARTAGMGQSEDNFKADVDQIVKRWMEIGHSALRRNRRRCSTRSTT